MTFPHIEALARGPFQHAPLVRLEKIEQFLRKEYGISQRVYGKIELNETSTFKDRAAELQIVAAKAAGFKTVVAASSGNFAESLAFYSKKHGLGLTLFMPEENCSAKQLHRLQEACGAEVVLVPGNDYDKALNESNRYARGNRGVAYNANPGEKNKFKAGKSSGCIDNRQLQLQANGVIATEIVEQLRVRGIDSVGLVICPAGNGTLAAALHAGFRAALQNPPIMVATAENPLIRASIRKMRNCGELTGPIHVTCLTEAGAGSSAIDGTLALKATRQSGGTVVEVDSPVIQKAMNLLDEALQEATKCFQRKPVRVLPFAAAGLAAIIRQPDIVKWLAHGKRQPIEGPIVLVITGVEDGGS